MLSANQHGELFACILLLLLLLLLLYIRNKQTNIYRALNSSFFSVIHLAPKFFQVVSNYKIWSVSKIGQ